VSTLASHGRLPATVPDLNSRPRQLVFFTPIDTQLNDFLNEIHQIACLEPSIAERIDEDLDLHGDIASRLISSRVKGEQKPSAGSCISNYCGGCAGYVNVCCGIWSRCAES
jgi:hypothetical protein